MEVIALGINLPCFAQSTCNSYNSYNTLGQNICEYKFYVELKHFLNHDPGVKGKCDSIMVHAITQHVVALLYDPNGLLY